MTHYRKNQRFTLDYTLIDFIKDFLEEVFFTILILFLYKIGRGFIDRYKLTLKWVFFHTMLILYDHVVARAQGIEWRLLRLLPNHLMLDATLYEYTYFLRDPTDSHKPSLTLSLFKISLFFLFLKRLDPNLRMERVISVSKNELRTNEKHLRVYYSQSPRRIYYRT